MALLADPSDGTFDPAHVAEVTSWLKLVFEAAGKNVPEFEYTPRTITHLYHLAKTSQSRTQAAATVGEDARLRAAQYRSEVSRLSEVLHCAGISQGSISQVGLGLAQSIAALADALDLKDTEDSSFLVAVADLSLKRIEIEQKRSRAQGDSLMLLDNTRKAISRLTYLRRTLSQLEEEAMNRDASMAQWQINLRMMASKERQYLLQLANYKAMVDRVGCTPEIQHGSLMRLVERKDELDRQMKPILDTLRSYQDLPPDKALAELAIEDKRREYEEAEKYLEEALNTSDI